MAQRTFLGQLKELQDKVDQLQPAILTEIAESLVITSPDDTGAYILSHSIGRSGNVGKRISSHDRVSARDAHKEEALSGLLSQIASIPKDSTRIWVGNNAPHANAVEYGGSPFNWRRTGHFVYTTLRSRFPSLIQEAKHKVGLK